MFVNRLDSVESVLPFEYTQYALNVLTFFCLYSFINDSLFFFSSNFSFDFCQASEDEKSPSENLGQVVFGERIRPSPYKVNRLKI